VILLDVVMETEDSGLELANYIRNDLNNQSMQIVLRTGQPGFAPEEEVITKYEINAYKTKSELTRSKLFTTIATAIRAYIYIEALDNNRKGLQSIISATAALAQQHSVHSFSQEVLLQLQSLFGIDCECMILLSDADNQNVPMTVTGATDGFKNWINQPLTQFKDDDAHTAINQALSNQQTWATETGTCLYMETPQLSQVAIYVQCTRNQSELDKELLKIFCLNVSLGVDNARLFNHLDELAYSDPLTGLMSRSGLIDNAWKAYGDQQGPLTAFILDIDYFRHFIENIGFDFGDQVLQKIAQELKATFSHHAVISRLYSDVFALVTNENALTRETIFHTLEKQFEVMDSFIRVSISMGIAHSDEITKVSEVENLVREAEIALKDAKDNRRGSGSTFKPEFQDRSRNRLELASQLHQAFEDEELEIFLQPKVDLLDASIQGFEALVRWRKADKGYVSPADFVPLIEQMGMYLDFDYYILDKVTKLISQQPHPIPPISVNLSAKSLNAENLTQMIRDVTHRHGIRPDQIELEITENALISGSQAIAQMQAIKDMGFTICLDDFGIGYSSLSYLIRLPFDVIKIDREFVKDLPNAGELCAVLKCMLEMCESLNKTVVIEGVENQGQLDWLKNMGCRLIQGYYYYKPMPSHEALTLIQGEQQKSG